MGRYAFFNTGVEYKFAFAVQPSSDMTEFGGKRVEWHEAGYEYDIHDGYHMWEEKDKPVVLEQIRFLEKEFGIRPIDFSKVDEDDIYASIDEKVFCEINGRAFYMYALGILIYKQLEKTCPLTVAYEY